MTTRIKTAPKRASGARGLDGNNAIAPSTRVPVRGHGDPVGAKVAHELKNPLTGVKALVQLGLRNPTETSSHARLAVIASRDAAAPRYALLHDA